MMCAPARRTRSGRPSSLGNGTEAARLFCASSGSASKQRRVEQARRDGVDADAELGELARRRQRQRGDAALGGRIGGLSDLALEGGHRRGRDDDAALAVGERLDGLHVGGGQPHHVEGADEVDLDDALEVVERHRPVAADDALGRARCRRS